tara:strand:+ start:1830 stop:3287 length:1458 start_codon:yes stop_codon:yes gene_type:complete
MGYKQAYDLHVKKLANDPLSVALDALYNISSAKYKADDSIRQEREIEEKFNRNLRSTEISRLSSANPDISVTDFGNPIYNESDFNDYKNEIIEKKNLNKMGSQYNPIDGVMSKEAQQDMFTYGDTRYSLDDTEGILSQEDLFNYDAWLLGENGYGRDVARKHNHSGILYETVEDTESAYYGKYILDQGDYFDLREKGLLSDMIPDASGNYILDEQTRNGIIKKYNYWREGFVSSRSLPNKSQLSNLISDENTRDLQFENDLRENKKYEGVFDQLDNWKNILNPNTDGPSIIDENGDFSADYLVDGELVNEAIKPKEFMERYPLVYNWMKSNFTIESLFQDISSNEDLQTQLAEIPNIKEYFYHLFGQLQSVESERRKAGIGVSQYQHLNSSMIMGEARDNVLNDLTSSELFNGALYDEKRFNALDASEKKLLISRLRDLEAQYADRNSLNYSPNSLQFLSLYGYGDGATMPGAALYNLTKELRGK